MGTLALKGERRSDVGKGVARKLRMTGRIPAVYYGRGEEPIPLVVSLKELEELIHSAEGSNVIVDLRVGGDSSPERKALIREIQRDPVGGTILHLDLQHISLTERIIVEVPIVLLGTPTGVKDGGGILEHLLREVEVECLPTDIPSRLEVDVSGLNIGDSLHVSDLKADRITIKTDATRAIAAVVPPTILEEVKPAEEAVVTEPELVSGKKDEEEQEDEGEGKGKKPEAGKGGKEG
ncbi:MAG: 50S ribosomal protein L25 [Candidatus Eisenbacteria bacterium]|jgi:large subunit ribosomal protein L25|uniref:Large ribosomal subunit protein bL25 n=1 Tax=Eiseniibacteriota bacterium TaxID=2212470 RepID=A0A538TM34_UNCEI|nr:MAG: 50S ribosomal protein L25 [Candidatus Eisenbacteria bacterium]